MSFWNTLGGIAGGVGGFFVGGPAGAVVGATLGSGGNLNGAGKAVGSALGTNAYQAPQYTIGNGAYQNPNGDQSGNWNDSQNGLLASSNNAAPTAQNTQLGPASQSAGPNLGQYNQNYGNQQNLANQYGQMAAGNGPSLAAVQAKQQGAQNMSAALALQGSAQGGSSNPALAQYNVGNQFGQIQNQTNQNAVAGRTSEEMGAMQAQAGLYGQMQSGALGSAGMGLQNNQFNAGQLNQFGLQQGQMNQQTAMANLNSQQGQNQLNAQQQDLYNQNLQQQTLAQFQANQAQQQLSVQQQLGVGSINSQAQQAANAQASQWTSKILSSV